MAYTHEQFVKTAQHIAKQLVRLDNKEIESAQKKMAINLIVDRLEMHARVHPEQPKITINLLEPFFKNILDQLKSHSIHLPSGKSFTLYISGVSRNNNGNGTSALIYKPNILANKLAEQQLKSVIEKTHCVDYNADPQLKINKSEPESKNIKQKSHSLSEPKPENGHYDLWYDLWEDYKSRGQDNWRNIQKYKHPYLLSARKSAKEAPSPKRNKNKQPDTRENRRQYATSHIRNFNEKSAQQVAPSLPQYNNHCHPQKIKPLNLENQIISCAAALNSIAITKNSPPKPSQCSLKLP